MSKLTLPVRPGRTYPSLDIDEAEIETIVNNILSEHKCRRHVIDVGIDEIELIGGMSISIADDTGWCDAVPLSALNAVAEEFGFEEMGVEAFVSDDENNDYYDAYLCLFGQPKKHIKI